MTSALRSTPRMEIVEDPTPLPPWAGVKFTCERCRGEFQLEAADKCQHIDGPLYSTECRCGAANVVVVPAEFSLEELQRMLAIGFESEPDEPNEGGCLGAT